MNITMVAEHNVYTDPPQVIAVPAGIATIALPTEQNKNTGEISLRLIQNVGLNPMYYSENVSTPAGAALCDDTKIFHGYIVAGAQLDCTSHRQIVCVYSPLGTTISTTIRRRKS